MCSRSSSGRRNQARAMEAAQAEALADLLEERFVVAGVPFAFARAQPVLADVERVADQADVLVGDRISIAFQFTDGRFLQSYLFT